MTIKAGFIPFIDESQIKYEPINFGRKKVLVPHLSVDQLSILSKKVKVFSQQIKETYQVSEIIERIDQAILYLLNRSSKERRQLEKWLPYITRFDSEMIRFGITSYLKQFRKKELWRFLTEDFSNPIILDQFQPRVKGGFSKAIGPNLATHFWAGNVPGVPLWSLISSMLVKGGNIGKVSSSEPLFASIFARVLHTIDPMLAKSLAIVWWRGGDVERESVIGKLSDVVIGYGRNESLTSIKNRLPITTRFITYGHKVSFGIISRSSIDVEKVRQTVKDVAKDVMRYDQQGCYSPHAYFVQRDGKVSPEMFAKMLGHELSQLQRKYPRRDLSLERANALAKWQQQEKFQSFSKDGHKVFIDEQGAWTVVYASQGKDLLTPLDRTVKIVPYQTIADVVSLLAPYENYLQTIGIACSPEELFNYAERLATIGVTRLSQVGQMTLPEPGWHHDGRFNLLDLVRFVDIDRSAELYSEQFAPYVD